MAKLASWGGYRVRHLWLDMSRAIRLGKGFGFDSVCMASRAEDRWKSIIPCEGQSSCHVIGSVGEILDHA